ncbi:MAG: LysR family transcriptional regulator [Peptococcaceae bacterium]|nr:LysR family transcriptional regulator [Peptococcaceae bacterium]
MKVKLEGFYYLKDALKYGSLSAAAEHNYIAQSNFSREIAKLEDALGVKLIDRSKKGVVPTHTYRKIEKSIDDMLEALQKIETVCREEANGEKQKQLLKFGINYSINSELVHRIIEYTGCCEEETEFDFSLKRASNRDLIELLMQGQLDYVVVLDWFNDKLLIEKSKELQYEEVLEDDYVLCIGPQFPYWDAEDISVEEALDFTQISFTEDFKDEEMGYYNKWGKIPPKFRYISDLNTAVNIISNSKNCVIALKSSFEGNPYLLQNKIRILPLKGAATTASIYLVYNKTKTKSETEQRFIIDVKYRLAMS